MQRDIYRDFIMPKRKKIRTVNTIAFKSKDYEDILSEKQACDLFALT